MSCDAARPKALHLIFATHRAAALRFLTDRLRSKGYSVECHVEVELSRLCARGQEHRADLVVLDADLPTTDGSVARQIGTALGAPVIMLGEMDQDRVLRALRGGAVDFIAPDRPNEALEAVERALLVARERRVTDLVIARTHGGLLAARRQLQAVLDQLPGVMWTTDRAHRITSVEGAGLRDLGVDLTQLIGRPATDLLGNPASAPFVNPQEGSLETSFELCGRVFNAKVRALQDDNGQTAGTIGVALDVTERRLLQSQLEASQKLEVAGRLSGGIAHDINNVLMVVDGYASLVLEDIDEGAPLRSDVEAIRAASGRASRLVAQLAAVNKRQHGSPATLTLGEVLEGLEGLMRHAVGKHIRLDLRTAEYARRIHADAVRLQLVLLTLVTRARDGLPDGGSLAIETFSDFIEPTGDRNALRAGQYVGVRVVGSGPGSGDVDTPPGATGPPQCEPTDGDLGVVRRIVDEHGGGVFLRARPGTGPCFEVLLPVVDQHGPGLDAPQEAGHA